MSEQLELINDMVSRVVEVDYMVVAGVVLAELQLVEVFVQVPLVVVALAVIEHRIWTNHYKVALELGLGSYSITVGAGGAGQALAPGTSGCAHPEVLVEVIQYLEL